MLDWLRNNRLWRWFSELDTLASLVQCLKIGAGVVSAFIAAGSEWFDKQPGFVLALLAFFLTIGGINQAVMLFNTVFKKRTRTTSPSLRTSSDTEQQIVTTSPPTIRAGLYVCDMRFTFSDLEKDRHSELTMRVFNGTGSVVEFSNLLGQVKFRAPNTTDPDRMGTLPTPTLRSDAAMTVAHLQEWFLILTQRVPGIEADKLLAMLAADIPILFDLRELTIEVVGQHDRSTVERLPIWGGVSYSRDNGFGRIAHAVVNLRE
jgi:hypothetical protein